MRAIPLLLSCVMLLGAAIGQSERSPASADKNLPTQAAPMSTGVKRHLGVMEIATTKLDACKKLLAAIPEDVALQLKSAHLRNLTGFLKELGGKHYLITYFEYAGNDWERDTGQLEKIPAISAWQKSICELEVAPGESQGIIDGEEVFFTAGATEVVPTPDKYARIGMITGLKPEKEAEYRTLHATTWPGVLKGIKDCNDRNFSINLVDLDGHLYLIGYLEYVGKNPDADAAAGKALPVNKRWWKFTDACQLPLPAATAKGELWDGMTEIYHLD